MTNLLRGDQEHHVSQLTDQSGGSQPDFKQSQSDFIESLRVSVPL